MNHRAAKKAGASRAAQGKRSDASGLPHWLGLTQARSYGFILVLAATLLSGLAVVNTTHKNRVAFNELQELREQANRLDVQWGQLLLEQSTFGVEGRIEQKALEQLGMKVPEMSNIVMVKDVQ